MSLPIEPRLKTRFNPTSKPKPGQVFKSEIKRALCSRGFLIALIMASLLLLVGLRFAYQLPSERSFVEEWYVSYTQSFYHLMLPLIACFPFADSLVTDRKQGYLERLAVRERFGKVISAKFLANSFAGGLAASIPLVLLYAFTSLTNHNPLNHPIFNTIFARPYEIAEVTQLYNNSPDFFILLVIAVVFIVAAIFASLGMASTLLVNQRFVAFSLPFLVANALQYFASDARLIPWYWAPSEVLLKANFSSTHNFEAVNEIPYLLILPLCLILLIGLLIFFFGKRKQVLENSLSENRKPKDGFSLSKLVPSWLQNFPVNEKRLKKGTVFGNYFRNLLNIHIQPIRIVLIVLVVAVLTIVMFGWMKLRMPSFFAPDLIGNPPNTWDLYFMTIGDPLTMALIIANLFLFMISDLQPQSAFGQLAVKRLGSRKQSWLAHILFLFLSAIAYSLIVFLTMHLTGRLLGLPFSNQWSIYRNSAEHINIPVFLTIPNTHFQAFLAVFGMSTLGFFAMSLLVLLINTLTQRRLIGYLMVEILLIASLPLSSILLNVPVVLQYLPIIRNLVMRFYPFVFRNLDQAWHSVYAWLIWLAILIPVTWLAYRKQDYLSHPDYD